MTFLKETIDVVIFNRLSIQRPKLQMPRLGQKRILLQGPVADIYEALL